MSRRGYGRNSMEMEPVRSGFNQGYNPDEIYENQATIKEQMSNQRPPCVGQEKLGERYECLQEGRAAHALVQPEAYEVCKGGSNNSGPEEYEPLKTHGSDKQQPSGYDEAGKEEYKEFYLTVLGNNTSPTSPGTTDVEQVAGGQQDVYDDIMTSKPSKKRRKTGSGKASLVKHAYNHDESDGKVEPENNSHRIEGGVSYKAFRCLFLLILFVLLVASVALVLFVLVIVGVVGLKGNVNSCSCTNDIKTLQSQVDKLQTQMQALTNNQSRTTPTTTTTTTKIPTKIPLTSSCRSGWVAYNNSCYYLHSAKATKADAESGCVILNSTLLSIESSAENDFIVKKFLSCSPISIVTKAWLGLSYIGNISSHDPYVNYKWASGQSISYRTSFSNSSHLFTDTCFLVRNNTNWESSACSTQYSYICEGKPGAIGACHVPQG